MYVTQIANIIDNAVRDCIQCGSGRQENGKGIRVEAEWAGNETDIEITIFEHNVIRVTLTEAPDL